MTQVLLLGGTFDAHLMSTRLHEAGVQAIYSYAGATQTRRTPVLPSRVGGFGGIDGLMRYLQEQGISHVIDATHPFATQMSSHAIAACTALGIPLLSLERRPWQATPGGQWTHVPDMSAAAAALLPHCKHVFLAIGRKQLAAFADKAALHHFLLRVIDAGDSDLPLPAASYELLLARGPFQLEAELALLKLHSIDCVVSKNAGGTDTYAKIEAARLLQIPVIMVDRPRLPVRPQCETAQEAMEWLNSFR